MTRRPPNWTEISRIVSAVVALAYMPYYLWRFYMRRDRQPIRSRFPIRSLAGASSFFIYLMFEALFACFPDAPFLLTFINVLVIFFFGIQIIVIRVLTLFARYHIQLLLASRTEYCDASTIRTIHFWRRISRFSFCIKAVCFWQVMQFAPILAVWIIVPQLALQPEFGQSSDPASSIGTRILQIDLAILCAIDVIAAICLSYTLRRSRDIFGIGKEFGRVAWIFITWAIFTFVLQFVFMASSETAVKAANIVGGQVLIHVLFIVQIVVPVIDSYYADSWTASSVLHDMASDFEIFLSTDKGGAALRAFATKSLTLESILFLDAERKYRMICRDGDDEEERLDMIDTMISDFLMPNAPMELNVSAGTAERYRRRNLLANVSITFRELSRESNVSTLEDGMDLFNPVYKEVIDLLINDVFPRFLQEPGMLELWEEFKERRQELNMLSTPRVSTRSFAV
ncbi:unnamed protein product (mitochondrion) [Plasmodiophora brassicae]|uniref:RGS domain-containing protein n=1 Tax=Plasmodiophora brassicae TaxID=37360 RepID=A0A0G4J6K2_PLABS|nr:hypothetical protein PBRA_009345 [Plasmodiophora brassicae]SPR02135.1 unnamed protein product [Plasmodiophora brassicae]